MGGEYLGYDIGIDFAPETVVSTENTGSWDTLAPMNYLCCLFVGKLLYPTFQHNVNTIYCHCLLPVLLPPHPTLYQTRCSPDSPTDVPARVEGGGDQHGPHPARDPPHPGAPAAGLSGQPELRQEKSRRPHARRPRPQAWREGAA